jgi:putative transposase
MASAAEGTDVGNFPEVIRVDEEQLRGHVQELVRKSVERTLNALLDAEADAQCGAKRYERSHERLDTRAGH